MYAMYTLFTPTSLKTSAKGGYLVVRKIQYLEVVGVFADDALELQGSARTPHEHHLVLVGDGRGCKEKGRIPRGEYQVDLVLHYGLLEQLRHGAHVALIVIHGDVEGQPLPVFLDVQAALRVDLFHPHLVHVSARDHHAGGIDAREGRDPADPDLILCRCCL